jgi:hypothetical protein
MNKSTALYIMSAIYLAPYASEWVALSLSVCFLVLALIWSWIEGREQNEQD